MPLQMRCTSCDADFKVREDLVGKKVRCPQCKEPILVTASKQPKAPDKPPCRSRSEENERDEPIPSSRKRNLLIGAGVGGALLIALIVVVVVVNSKDDKDTKPPPPVVDARKDQSKKDADKKDADKKDRKDKKDADRKDADKKDADKKDDKGKIEPFQVARWELKPDPGADMSKGKEAPAQTEFFKKGMGGIYLLWPDSPSPYTVAIHDKWYRVDTQTGEYSGFTFNSIPQGTTASADCKHVAVRKKDGEKWSILIHSTTDGKEAGCVESTDHRIIVHAFGPSGQYLVRKEPKKGSAPWIYEVWDFVGGKKLVDFSPVSARNEASAREVRAFSPGRRYFVEAAYEIIRLIDLTTGKEVGRIENVPRDQVEAAFFSPDGSEFTIYLADRRVLSWDVSTGKNSVDFKFHTDPKTLGEFAYAYKGPILQWLPDNSGWLLYGRTIIDRATHSVIYEQKKPADQGRLVSQYHLFGCTDTTGLRYDVLPRDAILASMKETAEKRGPLLTEFPAPTMGDLSAVRELKKPGDGATAWQMKPKPLPKPDRNHTDAAILLKGTYKRADIRKVLFPRDVPTQVLVAVVSGKNRTFCVDRFDLTTGNQVERVELCPAGAIEKIDAFGATLEKLLLDVSPDGRRLLVCSDHRSFERSRVDVFSLKDSKHLCGWVVHPEGYPGRKAGVIEAQFAGNDHVLTCLYYGRINLWSVPDCKAVYKLDGYEGGIHVYPAGDYFFACNGKTLDVLETMSGEPRGRLEYPQKTVGTFIEGHCSADGTRLIARIKEVGINGAFHVAWWDLTKGSFGEASDLFTDTKDLHWISNDFYWTGTDIASPKVKQHIRSFPRSFQVPTGVGPDGRHWVIRTKEGTQDQVELIALTFPDAELEELARAVQSGPFTVERTSSPAIIPGTFRINAAGGKTFDVPLKSTKWPDGK